MWKLSPLASETLRTSHTFSVRVTAYTAIQGVLTDLPISGGSVTYDAKSQTRRTATLNIADPALWPDDPLSVLSPWGSEISIEYGIQVPGVGTEWIPLIRGPITEAKRTTPPSSSGAVALSIADRSRWVAENRMDQPTQTVAGATAVAEITRLITETLPNVTVTDYTGSTTVAAQIDIDKERWADGVEKLADAISAEVYADRTGGFVIRPTPQVTDPAVWIVNTGDRGVLVSYDETGTREQVYNAVIASGQRSDGTPPVWAKVTDDDPLSPTRYGGPFGKKPRYYVSPLLTTTAQCTSAAQALLQRVKGIAATVGLTTLVNPALDPGDVVVMPLPNGGRQAHIIDAVTIPLDTGTAQKLTTRSLELPPEQ